MFIPIINNQRNQIKSHTKECRNKKAYEIGKYAISIKLHMLSIHM